jgi:hypothetical protein
VTPAEYRAILAIHRASIEQAIHDARDAGLVFDDFVIRFRYPKDLGGGYVCSNRPPDPMPETIPVGAPGPKISGAASTERLAVADPVGFRGRTGDVCPECGSSDLRPSGACTVCAECGSSTGCG